MSGVMGHFEEIAQITVQECEAVEGTVPEFIEGLGVVIDALEESRTAAVEMHKATGQR